MKSLHKKYEMVSDRKPKNIVRIPNAVAWHWTGEKPTHIICFFLFEKLTTDTLIGPGRTSSLATCHAKGSCLTFMPNNNVHIFILIIYIIYLLWAMSICFTVRNSLKIHIKLMYFSNWNAFQSNDNFYLLMGIQCLAPSTYV